MLFPHLSFVLEVVGACLLFVMIVYAVQLNRRLSALRSDKANLEKLIATFNASTERAEASVAKLRAGTTASAESLKESMAQAKQLRDDLAFMIDRAGHVADRLEQSIGAGRGDAARRPVHNTNKPPNGLRPANASRPAPQPAPERSGNKAELLRALAGIR